MRTIAIVILLLAFVLLTPFTIVTEINDLFPKNSIFGSSGEAQNVIQNKAFELIMDNNENKTYEIANRSQMTNNSYRIGFLVPSFTYAAYNDNSFYDFYHKYKDTEGDVNVTTDLALLRDNEIPEGPFMVYNAKPGAGVLSLIMTISQD